MELEGMKRRVDEGQTAELIVSDDIFYHLIRKEDVYVLLRLIVCFSHAKTSRRFASWDELCRYTRGNREIARKDWDLA